MTDTAPADATQAPATKPSRVWPKLLLWSLVLAFGFLYLRSLDYPAKDYPQAEAPKPAQPPQSAPVPTAAQIHPAAMPTPAEAPQPAAPPTPVASAPTSESTPQEKPSRPAPVAAPVLAKHPEQDTQQSAPQAKPAPAPEPVAAPATQRPGVAYPQQPYQYQYPNQYADYMRQQREAYEAARKRWEEAYGQQRAPVPGGYPGYYPPGYYQGGR